MLKNKNIDLEDIFIQAIEMGASDVHIEPLHDQYQIRFRINGLLKLIQTQATDIGLKICARIKIMSNLNIAEKRLPQDGKWLFLHQKNNYNFRCSTIPTINGEKVVVRILNSNKIMDFAETGMTEQQIYLFKKNIEQKQGLIIFTGATGSGKTSTLYSALSYLNQQTKNIITVEDPVEINIKGINQINTHEKIGLTFARCLRAILRQDPDIIMIGEIRDKETCQIAIQAAQTGHMVLTSLHTNSTKETLIRLKQFISNTYDLAYSLKLIVAQHLTNKKAKEEQKQEKTGQRTAIFDMLEVNDSTREQLFKQTT